MREGDMWFTGQFSVPEPVLQAQREGKLVLFVGAGASMGAPSYLPDFAQLATSVALDVGVEVTDEVRAAAKAAPDKFLTELEERDYPVHERIQQLVGLSAEPNRVHRALVRLFAQVGDLRIVTTNYDQHLTVAAREVFGGAEPVVYRAPALPLGRDFTGIVHLHGCLDQRPQDLVATFGDFGRAYLTDAWATRFLQEMFRTFTVLFVGYSHDDQIMQYLARGLPPGTQRFGLIGGEAPAQWKALGITAVTYPDADGHAALGVGLERWAEVSGWGQLQHERKIRDLVTAPEEEDGPGTPSVPTDPGDLSYLGSVFQDDTIDLFTRHAQDPVWLTWANAKPAFTPLFWPGPALDRVGKALAWWFASSFGAKHPAAAWSVVRERRGVLHPEVAQEVALALMRERPAAQVVAGWVPILLRGRTSGSALSWLLSSLSWPEHQGSILLLLDHLLAPQPQLGFFSASTGTARFDMDALVGDEYSLREAWGRLSPHIDEFAARLLPGLERHLRNAHLAVTADRGEGGLDVRSLQRSAIEPHEQDAHHTGFDLLIDIARDCSQHLASAAPKRAASTFESWVGSGVPILQRLAVHGWNASPDVSADDKLRWLLEHELLYATATRHEVFRLIASALPEAGQVRGELLEQILADPYAENGDAEHDERRAYAIYGLLGWVASHDESFADAGRALVQLKGEHPNFEPSRHPDLFAAFESIVPQSPFSAEQLCLMESDEDIDALDDYQAVPAPGTFTDRWALLSKVAEAATISPSWGVTVARRLIAGHRWTSDLWPRLFEGWTQVGSDLTEEQALEVLDVLALLDRESVSADKAATVRLLLAVTAGPAADPVQDAAGAMATTLVEAARQEAPDAATSEPYGDWVLSLTEFWLRDAYQRWSATEEGRRTGIPEPSRNALDALVDDGHPRHLTAIATLARNLVPLIAMDEGWTTTHLLPAFDWTNPDTAKAAWGGYLTLPRWNERVLELLRPALLKAFIRIGGDELRDALITHTADLCLYSASAAKPETGIVTAFFGSSDNDGRKLWAQQIAWLLSKLPPADAQGNWERWIKDYWLGRLNSLPRPLTEDETGEMLDWVLPSGALFPDAVDLLVGSPSRFKGAFSFFRSLKDSPVLTTHPAAAARLATHVLTHLEGPVMVCDEIGGVIATLIAVHDPDLVADLRGRLV